MNTTSIFGFTHTDLLDTRNQVERALGVNLEARESLYKGAYFSGSLRNGQLLQLRYNCDPLFDEKGDPPHERFSEPDFPDARLLLYVPLESSQARQMLGQVVGISFLAERENEAGIHLPLGPQGASHTP